MADNAEAMMTAQGWCTQSKVYGLVGLLGAVVFTLSLTVLHLVRTEIDWRQDYVSHFVHGRLGWLFVSGAVVHGFGNLALGQGLRRSLGHGRARTWAVLLFGIAAAGIVLGGLLPIDPSGTPPTFVGRVHRGVIYVAFLGELVALFLFSFEFARNPGWQRRSGTSFVLSAIATIALAGFLAALLLHRMLGMAERWALSTFMAWEFWAAFQLIAARRATKNGRGRSR